MIDLKPHNLDAYEKVKEVLTNGKNRVAVSHATGSGKSYLIAQLCEDHNEDKKLILVPSNYIREQIEKLLKKYEIQNYEFMVYQKFIKLSDDDIVKLDYKLIVLDEYHHNTSKVWGAKIKCLLESHPESIVFGTSATPVRSDGVNTIDELFEGGCASELSLSDAIAKKIVPIPTYVSAMYSLDDELERLREKVKNATNTKEEKAEYYEKIKAMRTQIDKAYGMPIILNKYLKNKEGKYLIFCRNKAHLEEIKDTVIEWFKTAGFKDINSYVVHSSYEQKNKEYISFCEDTSHKMKLLFSVNMLNEGLHLSNISGVLLLRPTNSNIVWHQQIGRCIEANNTENPVIIDATNDFQSIRQGIALFKAIKGAVAKEKGKNRDFDDRDFLELDTFFVTGYVQEIQKMFTDIEVRLVDSWNSYVELLTCFKERTGNCLVPNNYIEVLNDGTKVMLGSWVGNIRAAKKGRPGYLLTSERITQLENLGFIWDDRKHSFEKCINEINQFKRKNRRYPLRHSNDKHESKLGEFRNAERCRKSKAEKYGKVYSEWKVTIINKEGLFDFFEEKENRVDKFCRMALEYKKSNGHLEINSKDIINGYSIGSIYNALLNDYKNKKISEVQIKKIANVGIDITRRKREQRYDRKMNLARQALRDRIVINSMNQNYKGVNLFEWYRAHKDRFSEEELTIVNKLISNNGNYIPIKIIDYKTKKVLNVSPSISEAAKVLHRDFGIGKSEDGCVAVIRNRLTGKVKNPVYKGRFIFQYADSTDQSEPA